MRALFLLGCSLTCFTPPARCAARHTSTQCPAPFAGDTAGMTGMEVLPIKLSMQVDSAGFLVSVLAAAVVMT